MHPQGQIVVRVMKALEEYPPGLIGTVTTLFGGSIAASHGVDWTLEAMIAEQQCELFRRFDPRRDRVWAARRLRGRGLGRRLMQEAMQFCRESGYRRIYLTTLPRLDAALHLYEEFGFTMVSQAAQAFHGSRHLEQVLECYP
ncbi:MAG: GNAT family N-acetyltransferase [Steroidobacteraceae bacterium]